jgi:hypothetical protein
MIMVLGAWIVATGICDKEHAMPYYVLSIHNLFFIILFSWKVVT